MICGRRRSMQPAGHGKAVLSMTFSCALISSTILQESTVYNPMQCTLLLLLQSCPVICGVLEALGLEEQHAHIRRLHIDMGGAD